MAINNINLTGEHISTNLAAYEAARSGFFTLQVTGINSIPRANYGGVNAPTSESDKLTNKAESYLQLNVVKSSVPHFKLETLSYRRGNDEIKFAGVPTFDSGTLVVDDVVGLDTKSILMAWQAQAYNVYTRKGGRMKDYKKLATLSEYTQDFELIRQWKLYGCWISDLSEDDFDKESDGKRQITATIEYDRAEMVMQKTIEGTTTE